MIEQQNSTHPDLNELPEDVLEQMLVDAEQTLRDIRTELRSRRAVAHAGIELDLPQHDLNEARGRWMHFIDFVREMSDQETPTTADDDTDEQDGEEGHPV